jgi:hypothetical protein
MKLSEIRKILEEKFGLVPVPDLKNIQVRYDENTFAILRGALMDTNKYIALFNPDNVELSENMDELMGVYDIDTLIKVLEALKSQAKAREVYVYCRHGKPMLILSDRNLGALIAALNH